jgi:hypothetical protein
MSLFTVRMNAQKGIALILTILSIMILGVLAAGFMVSSTTEHKTSFNDSEAAAAVQCADGGISWGFQALNEMQPPPCATGGSQVFGTHTHPDGSINRLTFAFADSNDCSDVYQGWGYTLQSECTRPSGVKAAIEMKAIAHQETPACMIIPGCCNMNADFWDFDVIEGRFHSNDAIRVFNSAEFPPRGPRFTGRVSTAQDYFVCSGLDEMGTCPEGYARFDAGYQLNVQGIDCEVDYDAAELCAQAMNGGIMLHKGEAWITMIPDGTLAIFIPGDPIYGVNPPPMNDPPGLIVPIPPSGVVALDGHGGNGYMHVSGTVNGRLTLMSGSKMFVEGDCLMVDDPRFGPSDDALGFLAGWMQAADGNLIFPDMVVGGPDGDRLVFSNYVGPHCNASILVENYQQRDNEGILMIYGSIMQGQLRPTQTEDGNGYATLWILDPRACPDPPPCFPDLTRTGLPLWIANKVPHSWHEVF